MIGPERPVRSYVRPSCSDVSRTGIMPDTKALRCQSMWNLLVAGSTSTTSLRAVIIGSRLTEASTLSCAWNGARPGPEICRFSFTSGWSLMRVPVSPMPVTSASASTPPASSCSSSADRIWPKPASPSATRTSMAVTSRPAQNIHFSSSSWPEKKYTARKIGPTSPPHSSTMAWALR
ncbi:Uncharacterised protein [Mycobacteroides abscessus subsp. abscessus]|nr:Uncharacterised protein [Mycobacteroides abscessus subsp. abscessus]